MLVTALATPFRKDGVDVDLLQGLTRFQLEEGAQLVLLAGTTGEGAALTDGEWLAVLDAALEVAPAERLMAGLGSGRLEDVILRGRAAVDRGVRDLLLVDCPYSGACSAALREAWHGPVARALPEARLVPYAVPGRTGVELLPDDLALLAEEHANVVGVKDATGRLARMERVRELCGEDFVILCGDDLHLRDAMIDPDIRAQGGCSVAANLAPRTMRALVDACAEGRAVHARELCEVLADLFGLTSLATVETVEVGGRSLDVPQRVRNPVPLKAALEGLGVMSSACRPPLADLGSRGRALVAGMLRRTAERAPGIFDPIVRRLGADHAAGLAVGGALVGGR